MQQTTICALATPPGPGGIAVVRISGPEAYAVAGEVFRPADPARSLAKAKGYTALFGHFYRAGRPCDETVALCFRAPKSYTGEDVVELSCHGGPAVVEELLAACREAGAAPAGAGEFTRRAFLNGRIGLTQAEAVMGLISAAGRQGAALASAALDGALAREMAGLQAELTGLLGHIDAWVDFPEEDVPALSDEALCATLTGAAAVLDKLLREYGAGAVLRRGVETAIVGRPNVGKSTLLNLLAGFDRAIVTPVPGTTRDVVEQAVQLGESGIRLQLADTAGLRETADLVEAEGVRRSRARMEQAGLVLAVFDQSRPLEAEDRALARACAGRCVLAVLNKADLPPAFAPEQLAACFAPGAEGAPGDQPSAARSSEMATPFSAAPPLAAQSSAAGLPTDFSPVGAVSAPPILPMSANDPADRQKLADAIERLLGTAALDPGAAALVSERQHAAALAARRHLADALAAHRQGFGLDAVGACVEDALNALYELTGESASEAAIEEVFSQFCVGK